MSLVQSNLIFPLERTRHRVLALALSFVCAVNELSPGAYLLRQDLYPALSKVRLLCLRNHCVLSKSRPQIILSNSAISPMSADASIILSLLSNYHKTDAANLNPYLSRISHEKDENFLASLGRVIHARCEASIQ